MRPRLFSGLTFIRKAKNLIFDSQGCIKETVEELYDQNRHTK